MYRSKYTLVFTPIFGQLTVRDNFSLVLGFLYFVDNNNYNANNQDRDRPYKIREVTDMIRRIYSNVYYRRKRLSFENFVLFTGRLSFKQYIKSKRAKFKIKAPLCCISDGSILEYITLWKSDSTADRVARFSNHRIYSCNTGAAVFRKRPPFIHKHLLHFNFLCTAHPWEWHTCSQNN